MDFFSLIIFFLKISFELLSRQIKTQIDIFGHYLEKFDSLIWKKNVDLGIRPKANVYSFGLTGRNAFESTSMRRLLIMFFIIAEILTDLRSNQRVHYFNLMTIVINSGQ